MPQSIANQEPKPEPWNNESELRTVRTATTETADKVTRDCRGAPDTTLATIDPNPSRIAFSRMQGGLPPRARPLQRERRVPMPARLAR